MKLIKPNFEIWTQEEGLEGVYKQIERAGRVCYKSEDKITDTSAKDFVDRMIKSGHGAMLEHGTVYLKCDFKANDRSNAVAYGLWSKYKENQYSEVAQAQPVPGIPDGFAAITTNLRVLVESNWLDDLKYLCEPTEFHEKRVTVKFICDRGVSHEFVRHRVFSFAQESTRYCNYSKDKFGNECTFIIPVWLDLEEGSYRYEGVLKSSKEECIPVIYSPTENRAYNTLSGCEGFFLQSLSDSEIQYFKLLDKGWIAQQARAVLPNSLKTELVMTGFTKDWEHFFKLRDAGSAHPQARELAHPLHMEFLRRNYLVDLYDEANPD